MNCDHIYIEFVCSVRCCCAVAAATTYPALYAWCGEAWSRQINDWTFNDIIYCIFDAPCCTMRNLVSYWYVSNEMVNKWKIIGFESLQYTARAHTHTHIVYYTAICKTWAIQCANHFQWWWWPQNWLHEYRFNSIQIWSPISPPLIHIHSLSQSKWLVWITISEYEHINTYIWFC